MRALSRLSLAAALLMAGTSVSLPIHAQRAARGRSDNDTRTEAPASRQRPDPTANIREVIDRVYGYLDSCTPARLEDGAGRQIRDFSKIDMDSRVARGDFSISCYEWGVTYSGMLLAAEATGEKKYSDYVYDRLNFLGKMYPYAQKYYDETGYSTPLRQFYAPKWLDDCGAMTAAMLKATLRAPKESRDFRALMEHWYDFVMYREYRLGDGILARTRPTVNSVWLDDMYMGITPIAYRAKLMQAERGDLTQKYFNEAVNQVLLFKKYLWCPEKNLYRHGWIEGMSVHPDYHWARANGWAALTMSDVLDVLPANFQGREEVLGTLRSLIEGIAPLQSPEGTWHQLLDKTESYLETSASAMFVYVIAHAINQGWIDRTAYQDIAKSGWAAVARQVNARGEVENTCVGTGLGWTNTFYESRPVSVKAAHGYGPVLLAAAEMIKLYSAAQPAGGGQAFPFTAPAPVRTDGKPVVWLAGDSTCKNGRGAGDNGQWGWGSFFSEYMTDAVTIANEAVGGLSSRTFYNANWSRIRDNIREGDYVIIQFGHNDRAPLGSGRARGTLSGTSDTPEDVVMEKNGSHEKVYSYGHYIRMMIRQAKMRGAVPIVISPTPMNSWKSEKSISRYSDTYSEWCKTVAAEEGVLYIDFNDAAASRYEAIGRKDAQKDYFADGVHTYEKGARLYCETLAGLLAGSGSPLARYVKK